MAKITIPKSLDVKLMQLMGLLNFSLGYLNWIVIPFKIGIFIIGSLITKIIEPYKLPNLVPNFDKSELKFKCDEFNKRLLDKFRYEGFVISMAEGGPLNGRNHDSGDWCLMNGMYISSLCFEYEATKDARLLSEIEFYAKQYTDNWILDSGMLTRGWLWKEDGTKEYDFRITMDQLGGLAFAMSVLPFNIFKKCCGERFLNFVNMLIENNYNIPDPMYGKTYRSDYRLGLLAYGGAVPQVLTFLALAFRLTSDQKYKKELNKFIRKGGLLLCMFPFGKLFEILNDFAYNVTLISLTAFYKSALTETQKNACSIGAIWIWWINRKVLNPWWNFLKLFISGKLPKKDLAAASYMLSTVGENNYNDKLINPKLLNKKFSNSDAIIGKKYFRLFGKEVYTLPPKYNDKASDDFMFQRIERWTSQYGERVEGDVPYHYFNMVFFIVTYWLYRNIENIQKNDD